MLYTSELTNETYKTVKELEEAEKKYNEAHKAELLAKEERKNDLAVVQTAADNYFDLLKKNNGIKEQLKAEEQKAYEAYKNELDEFSKKHNGYHLTYKADGDNIEFKIEENHRDELLDYLEEQERAWKSLFSSFWRF